MQLQQVMMNLITNSIDAMKDVDGTRELAIESRRAEHEQLIAAAGGLPTTLRGAQRFTSVYPPRSRHMNDARRRSQDARHR